MKGENVLFYEMHDYIPISSLLWTPQPYTRVF